MNAIDPVLGLCLVFFGRNLFWLMVGLAGFLLGVELVPLLFPDLQTWLVLLVGCAAGIIGALLSILAQRVALGLAGFLIGALLGIHGAQALAMAGMEPAIALGGGVVGTVVAVLLTNWAIIMLSSGAGAIVVVTALGLSGGISLLVLALLFGAGVAVQGAFMRRSRISR